MGKKSRRRQNRGSGDGAASNNGQYVASASIGGGAGGFNISRGRVNHAHANNPSSWAGGLSKKDQYEWLCNCYQMRCDDDYVYGGCNLHGPYNPDATPESIADDFLVFCTLANRAKAFPSDWDMEAFLKAAPEYIVFAFEKSDAKERWGNENYFEATMGGRSLRYTAEKIYKSGVQQPSNSVEHNRAKDEVIENPKELQNQLGGAGLWEGLVVGLQNSSRFQ